MIGYVDWLLVIFVCGLLIADIAESLISIVDGLLALADCFNTGVCKINGVFVAVFVEKTME